MQEKHAKSNFLVTAFFYLLYAGLISRFLIKVVEPGTDATAALLQRVEPALPVLDGVLFAFLLPAQLVAWILGFALPETIAENFPVTPAASFFDFFVGLLLTIPFIYDSDVGRELSGSTFQSTFPGVIDWLYPMSLLFWMMVENLYNILQGYFAGVLKEFRHQMALRHGAAQNRAVARRQEEEMLDKQQRFEQQKRQRAGQVREVIDDFKEEITRLQSKSNTDQLTGLFNRGFFTEALKQKMFEAYKKNAWYHLVMLDIDDFKQLNDTHGHVLGDKVLQKVSEVIKASCPHDLTYPCRYGGEEIGIIIIGLTPDQAVKLCEQIRSQVSALTFSDSPNVTTSVSMGLYSVMFTRTLKPDKFNEELILTKADELLYTAKHRGKNQVVSDIFR